MNQFAYLKSFVLILMLLLGQVGRTAESNPAIGYARLVLDDANIPRRVKQRCFNSTLVESLAGAPTTEAIQFMADYLLDYPEIAIKSYRYSHASIAAKAFVSPELARIFLETNPNNAVFLLDLSSELEYRRDVFPAYASVLSTDLKRVAQTPHTFWKRWLPDDRAQALPAIAFRHLQKFGIVSQATSDAAMRTIQVADRNRAGRLIGRVKARLNSKFEFAPDRVHAAYDYLSFFANATGRDEALIRFLMNRAEAVDQLGLESAWEALAIIFPLLNEAEVQGLGKIWRSERIPVPSRRVIRTYSFPLVDQIDRISARACAAQVEAPPTP